MSPLRYPSNDFRLRNSAGALRYGEGAGLAHHFARQARSLRRMSRFPFGCWFVLFLAAFVAANLLRFGDPWARRGVPLAYAWGFRGRAQGSWGPLVLNAVVALSLSAWLAWQIARRRGRPSPSERAHSLSVERKKPRVVVTTAWLLLGSVSGILVGGAFGWCLLGGILNFAGGSSMWSLGLGFLGALFGSIVGSGIGLALAVTRATEG